MSRSRLVAYWVTTGLVASSMLSAGVATSSTCKRASPSSCASATRCTFVTLSEQDALAEAGYASVPDPLRAHLQRRSH